MKLSKRISLAWRILWHNQSSGLVSYAEDELRLRANKYGVDDDYDGMCEQSVLEMLFITSMAGHSGGSMGVTMALYSRLAQFKPLTPINDIDSEWNEVAKDYYQHKRVPNVFKELIEGKWKRYYLNDSGKRVNIISFPYTVR